MIEWVSDEERMPHTALPITHPYSEKLHFVDGRPFFEDFNDRTRTLKQKVEDPFLVSSTLEHVNNKLNELDDEITYLSRPCLARGCSRCRLDPIGARGCHQAYHT